MVTTLAAVSLSIFSPIKAQNTLALMMIIGIFLDWLLTRFVLEDFYMSRREDVSVTNENILLSDSNNRIWAWPVCLALMALVTAISPPGVEVFDVNQFLSEDDPALDEFEEYKINISSLLAP